MAMTGITDRVSGGRGMPRIYLAGPLFCEAELRYNREMKGYLAGCGFDLVLPQEESADLDLAGLMSSDRAVPTATEVCRRDLETLDSCDALLINLDGRVPDEGACVELGYAYAKGKPVFGIKTDVRTAEYGIDNMMIVGVLEGKTARSPEELVLMFREADL